MNLVYVILCEVSSNICVIGLIRHLVTSLDTSIDAKVCSISKKQESDLKVDGIWWNLASYVQDVSCFFNYLEVGYPNRSLMVWVWISLV